MNGAVGAAAGDIQNGVLGLKAVSDHLVIEDRPVHGGSTDALGGVAAARLQQIQLRIDPGEALPHQRRMGLVDTHGDVYAVAGQCLTSLHMVGIRDIYPVEIDVDHMGRGIHQLRT